MKTIVIAHNATIAKVTQGSDEIYTKISDLLSYMCAGYEHTFSFTQGSWNGKSTFYNFDNNSFPAGFVFLVHKELVKSGYKVSIVRRPNIKPAGPESPIVDEFGNDNPKYDFQMKALKQVEKHGGGIIQVATGGGKSKIAKLIMARYRKMTLFLTTRGVLLYQMKDQLEEINFNTGVIGDGEFTVTKGVNLGMVQTLVQMLKFPALDEEMRAVTRSVNRSKTKNLTKDQMRELAKERFEEKKKRRRQAIKFLELIEVVIGEEAHEAGGDSYFEILKHCKNATIRVALTATPFMRDSAEDNLRLMAAFGPVLIKVSEQMLINRGVLAKPYFKFVNSEHHPKLHRTSPWARAYKFGYVENSFMHKDVIRDALMAKRYGLATMTLILQKEHGKILQEKMEKVGLRVRFLQGSNSQAERKAGLKDLGSGEIDVLLGTTILDVGVDVPAVGLVQLVGGGKAEVALRQRIGRALRAKKNMANVAFAADYTCNKNTCLSDHYRQRRNIIDHTPGFREGILPDGQDFDWSIFKDRKVA